MSLAAWWREKAAGFRGRAGSTSIRLAESRFLLLDIDVTGLDGRRDRARGVATLPLHDRIFRISEIAYIDLATPGQCGLSGSAGSQNPYHDLVEAMAGHLVVTYNPRFVRHMISRTAGIGGLAQAGSRWLDLRWLLTGVFGSDMGDIPSMRRWTRRFNIEQLSEHMAAGDVVAMAQLLQVVLAYCEDLGIMTLERLMEAKASSDWLRGE